MNHNEMPSEPLSDGIFANGQNDGGGIFYFPD